MLARRKPLRNRRSKNFDRYWLGRAPKGKFRRRYHVDLREAGGNTKAHVMVSVFVVAAGCEPSIKCYNLRIESTPSQIHHRRKRIDLILILKYRHTGENARILE